MQTPPTNLSPGFRVFYYVATIIGTGSVIAWVSLRGVEGAAMIWAILDVALVLAAWMIPGVNRSRPIPISFVKAVPTLLIVSALSKLVLMLLFSAA